ncbi:MAG: hypothetical protein PHR77_02565 [Kiritimatiellae bacterium]|nr:hypothetical protein [Kiritimatiellia bacterium]MDD5523364.1 hypothetical protein [Kiritimatiellia bacterium]
MRLKNICRIVTLVLCVFQFAQSGRCQAAESAIDDRGVFAYCYLKLILAQQVVAQAEKLSDTAQVTDKSEIKEATDVWWQNVMSSIRSDLEGRFGENSRVRFEKFIGEYDAAEKNKDREFLLKTASSIGLKAEPVDYGGLRRSVLETILNREMADASRWLGEVQTWIEVRQKVKDTPALHLWLSRDVRSKVVRTELKKPAKSDLASAEVAVEEFKPEKDDSESPLDSFSTLRKQKRDKALQEAQAGMQQVAVERQAAETEYAAKKMAAAQADADAMKSHAEKLAAVEKEALEQRQNGFGSKLKMIVGATVSGAIGSFTGGIGARAGQELVDAVFSDGHKK